MTKIAQNQVFVLKLTLKLRNEAKLSSLGGYTDSSTLNLPTAPEAIAELDASDPHLLRCRNCNGKLLQGIESLICVFCGKQQRTSDNPPEPIKFTSTWGYKLFLSSLDLDESPRTVTISPKYACSSQESLFQDRSIAWPESVRVVIVFYQKAFSLQLFVLLLSDEDESNSEASSVSDEEGPGHRLIHVADREVVYLQNKPVRLPERRSIEKTFLPEAIRLIIVERNRT
ncbi:hypothetical protein Bca101_057273 [Brassica carinata]